MFFGRNVIILEDCSFLSGTHFALSNRIDAGAKGTVRDRIFIFLMVIVNTFVSFTSPVSKAVVGFAVPLSISGGTLPSRAAPIMSLVIGAISWTLYEPLELSTS
jgi:hypothetical protein